MFLDETWLMCSVPHGHWHTTTFHTTTDLGKDPDPGSDTLPALKDVAKYIQAGTEVVDKQPASAKL